MFKASEFRGNMAFIGHDFLDLSGSAHLCGADLAFESLPHEFLILDSQKDFISLNDRIWSDSFKKSIHFLTRNNPSEKCAMIGLSVICSANIEASAKFLMKEFKRSWVAHIDTAKKLVSSLFPSGFIFMFVGCKAYIAFAIKKTSGIYINHLSFLEKGCEVGGNPMPGPKGCGRTIPSQASEKSLGVCNEQVQPPKGMVCSELHGNMQNLAETSKSLLHTTTHIVSIDVEVTDCNTDFIFLRPHSKVNMVPLETRHSINQDAIVVPIVWAGNMTCSNRARQGVMHA